MVVNYDVMDIESREVEVVIAWLGLATWETSQRGSSWASVRVPLTEFPEDSATYEFHLFSQDGEQVAFKQFERIEAINPRA